MRYLLSFGAIFFQEPQFKVREFGFCEDALWVFGDEGYRTRGDLEGISVADIKSRAFPDAGWHVMRNRGDYLLVSCGPNGQNGNGGHAHRVQSLLGEVHKAMLAALTAVETGSREAEAGAQLARATGETIRKLAVVIRESSEAAKQIATVAQKQDRGIDEVRKAMNEVFLAVEEGQAATQKVAAEAQALNSLAEGLKGQAKR